jgi:hypothetical protein
VAVETATKRDRFLPFQWPHSDAPRFDNREMISPIASRHNRVSKLLADIVRPGHGQAYQRDAAPFRQCRCLGKFTEVLVEGQKNARVLGSPRQPFPVGAAWCLGSDPNNVMTGRTKSREADPGKFSLARKRISSRARIHSFRAQHVAHRQDTQ